MPIVLVMVIASLNDAIEVYETALRYEPDNADVHYNVSPLWENPQFFFTHSFETKINNAMEMTGT